MEPTTDWAEWSRESVHMMQARNAVFVSTFGLEAAPYRWDLDSALLTFRLGECDVVADLCLVGTTSQAEGTFLWAWANETIPACAVRGLEEVRVFGVTHGLGLLTEPEWAGGRADALEVMAIAGRLLDAAGVFG